MTYQIEYAYTCHMGKVRANNEDNFWCCGRTMAAENRGTEDTASECVSQRRLPLLAVFDGMGGECCGEMAAFLAADTFGRFYDKNKALLKTDPRQYLEDVCRSMNQAVCDYGRENRVSSMGSTAAMLAFGKDAVYAGNLGDSRIYQSKEGQFRQLSTDHVAQTSIFGKAPLIQYVGVPEAFMALEPSIIHEEIAPGVRYLLCSDGVTDMLSDGEIADILSREIPVKESVEILLERALKKGGRDNITIVLCEIQEESENRFRQWIRNLLPAAKEEDTR